MDNETHFTVKVCESIADIPRKDWDSVYPPGPENYGFLKTLDETLTRQFKFYYISIYDKERIECAAPCFIVDYPLDTTLEEPVRRIISFIRRLGFPRFLTLRAIICGSPASEGHIGIRAHELAKDLIPILAREMDDIARREHAAVIAFKDFTGDYKETLKPLERMKFHKTTLLPYVELDLRFRSFDEYLDSLSKKTRADLRRKFKHSRENASIEMEVRTDLGDILDEAYELYQDNLGRAYMRFEEMTKEFFITIPKNMPQETKYFIWRANGKLAAFSLCLLSGGTLEGHYLGFDYSVAHLYHLYFIAFRDKITWCINNGVRKYHTGALNYDPKKRLDFKFIPEYLYVKHRSKIPNFFFSFLIAALQPEKHDPVLKSLKKPS